MYSKASKFQQFSTASGNQSVRLAKRHLGYVGGGEPPLPKPTEGVTVTLRSPPISWSLPAKAYWDGLPEVVRMAIIKREVEINEGMQRYAGVGRYRRMAEIRGITLADALAQFFGATPHG